MESKHLFITVINNAGSKLLVQLVGECQNAITLPKEGERYAQMEACVSRLWSQTHQRDKMLNEDRYDFDLIKNEWGKLWAKSRHFKTANPKIFVEKSPPNVLRAQMYEKHFPNAYFMIMVRNPYAVIEGILRRHNKKRPLDQATQHWIYTSRKTIENLEVLKHSVWFKYEDLCDRPKIVTAKIKEFMPELHDIDLRKRLRTHSQLKGGAFMSAPINLNNMQIKNLSKGEIKKIGEQLANNTDLMEFFGYEIIEANK